MKDVILRKTILILKPRAHGLVDAEKFLKNRDWRVQHTTEIKEAITLLVQTQPQFFLICLDHPSPTIKNIHTLISKSYLGCIILCAERASTPVNDLILNSSSEHKILPPVTGPAIERIANKFFRHIKERTEQLKLEKSLFEKEVEKQNQPDPTSFKIIKGPEPGKMILNGLNRRKDPKKVQNGWVQVEESLMIKGAEDALRNSLNVTTVNPDEHIDLVSNLACITIESSKFSGYLITAMGQNRKLDKNFIHKIQQRLIKFLRDSGEEIQEDQNFDLEVKLVPFEDWASEYAEFMRKSVHDGSEVAMAFFPRKDIKTIVASSYNEKMASIKINQFQADTPVQFNLYIHLPRNNKYVLYTPKGGVLYGDQKERLENQGVADLHVMKEDLAQLEKYRAENFLNEKISEFEEGERQNSSLIKPKKAA